MQINIDLNGIRMGSFLDAIRRVEGVTMVALSKRTNLSVPTLKKASRKGEVSQVGTIYSILKELDISISYTIAGEPLEIDDPYNFHQVVKIARGMRGVSQNKLANEVEVYPLSIIRLENEKGVLWSNFTEILKALNVEIILFYQFKVKK